VFVFDETSETIDFGPLIQPCFPTIIVILQYDKRVIWQRMEFFDGFELMCLMCLMCLMSLDVF